MNVLCIAPHPDDEAIGCGGSLALHARNQDQVSVIFLTSGELGLKERPNEDAWRIRESEAAAATKLLAARHVDFLRFPDWTLGDHLDAAVQRVSSALHSQPDLIYAPHPHEWHPDHKAAAAITRTCMQRLGISPAIRAYEVWTPLQEYEHAMDITAVWETKLAAVRAHVSQTSQWPYERAVQGLNQYRGAMAGRCLYAEVFSASCDPK